MIGDIFTWLHKNFSEMFICYSYCYRNILTMQGCIMPSQGVGLFFYYYYFL